MRQNYKVLLTSIIIVTLIIVSGLLLFGTPEATQTDTPDHEQQIKSECKPRGPKPICPIPNATPPNPQIKSECKPRGPKPICPNLNPTPRCPRDAAAQTEQPFNKENTHE